MKTLLFALGALALVGCSGLKPVGVLSKETPVTQQSQPLPSADPASKPPSLRPTPPTMLIAEADVDPFHPEIAARKLAAEVDTDNKATANLPVTAEISRYEGGVRQP